MKTTLLLQLAALATALVIPDEQVIANVPHENNRETSIFDRLPSKADLLSEIDSAFGRVSHEVSATVDRVTEQSKNVLDEAFDVATDVRSDVSDKLYETYFDAQSWLESNVNTDGIDPFSFFENDEQPIPPNNPDAPRKKPHHKKPDHDKPHHGPPHHRKPGHHHKSNLTVYELISKSNYTTTLAKLIDEFPDLVEALKGTEANFTIFAPTDKAFDKIPKHHPKPSKEVLKAILSYHVSPEFYPAGRILATRTIPTLLRSAGLGVEPLPQRLSTNIGLRGLTVNFYSRIIAVDIFGSNGVIHGVDSLILPPPKTLKIIDLLPSEFSTLELGLVKTGLFETLNSTAHAGGTFFAPSNFAFQKLGPRVNAFLFSKYGQKYLKALLEYHVVANHTLYSDAYYKPDTTAASVVDGCQHGKNHKGLGSRDHKRGPSKGLFHVDLPTLLGDKSLSIDVARYGRLIEIKINAFARVAVSDGVAEDGVLHVVSDVLIPPKSLAHGELVHWDSEDEMTVEELKERLEPFVGVHGEDL